MSHKRDSLPPKTQAAFLAALGSSANVRHACRVVGLGPTTVYKYRGRDPAFAQRWDEAMELAMDTVLEPEAIRRAVEGWEMGVYYQGQKVGVETQYSDTLLIFLLKGWRPDKYKDRREVLHAGSLALLRKMERIGTMTPDELQTFLQEVEQHVNTLEPEAQP